MEYRKLWILLTGYALLSVGCLFFFIASLPEIIDSVIQFEDVNPEDHQLNDMASGIFNGFFAFGAIIAPILGGVLKDALGYRYANDTIAIISCVFTVIFVLVYIFGPKPKYRRLHSVMDNRSMKIR